ncbi:MAG TPA: hypothetical protein VNT54_12315 [Solirubrobacteraceae bacterium]|nr:hypothetical protein [Solirubrobacteraceae bacterium]
MSAPPAATSTSGHVSASEKGSPSSRKVSRIATTRQPTPDPTSSAARRLRALRRCSAATAGAAAAARSAGSSHHASRYATRPRPLASVVAPKTMRSSRGSMSRRRPIPSQTPAIIPRSGSRRSARHGAAAPGGLEGLAATSGIGIVILVGSGR